MLDDPPRSVPSPKARFRDRGDAGRRLAEMLACYRDDRSAAVVAIPRGGVPVAAEVARALRLPLDIAVVRKVGAPGNPEYAIGALAEGGVRVFGEQAMRAVGSSRRRLDELTARVEGELLRRLLDYRGAYAPVALLGCTAILVDDGLATGRSAVAAVQSLRRRGAARVVLAVPVGAAESLRMLRRHADRVICIYEPEDLWAVGSWYEDFRPVADERVISVLARHRGAEETPTTTGEVP